MKKLNSSKDDWCNFGRQILLLTSKRGCDREKKGNRKEEKPVRKRLGEEVAKNKGKNWEIQEKR